jgi:hypothetical protein
MGKQKVILEMDVLPEVSIEFAESGKERDMRTARP